MMSSIKFSWISNINPQMGIHGAHFPSNLPIPLQFNFPLLGKPTHLLQPLFHGVVHLPPPRVRLVARVHALIRHIPVAVIVPVTEPRLQPQVMDRVQLRRIRPEQLVLHAGLNRRIGPEILQEIDPPRQPVPPDEHLVQKPLIPAVVGDDLVPAAHQRAEGAVGGLDDHDAGIEDVAVVAGGGHLGEVEEEVEVAQNDDVGVDEDDPVVVGELP